MKKKFFLAAGAFLAACTMIPSFTSCDKETRSEMLGNLIGQVIETIWKDSTTFVEGTWVCTYEEDNYSDTIRFGKMTQTPVTYETMRLNYSGSYYQHVVSDSNNYILKGVYSYIQSGNVMQTSATSSITYMLDGEKYNGVELVREDPIVSGYAVRRVKFYLTEDYGIHQLYLTEYNGDGVEIGTDVYNYVDETKK